MYKIHECTTTTCSEFSALYPTFSAMTHSLYMPLIKHPLRPPRPPAGPHQGQFYTGKNFNNYAVYIQDHSYVKQEIGQSANNEFALSQCGGATCPTAPRASPFHTSPRAARPRRPAHHVPGHRVHGHTNGGLMFMKGAVAAVIKPGALKAETKLEVTDPAARRNARRQHSACQHRHRPRFLPGRRVVRRGRAAPLPLLRQRQRRIP